jgi:hypothetical protein
MRSLPPFVITALLGVLAAPAGAVPLSTLRPVATTASSVADGREAARATDGLVTEESTWISAAGAGPAWLEVRLPEATTLSGVHVYTGFDPTTVIRDLVVQFWRDGAWVDVPSARISGNRLLAFGLAFDDTVAVTTDRLRLWITSTGDSVARVKELVVWPASAGAMPALIAPGTESAPDDAIPRLYLNQSGFNRGEPKRFTAPTLADGTAFVVRRASGGEALFTGMIAGHRGDFSSFDPESAEEFVVEAGGHRSVPFRIGHWWLERITYQRSVDFMIDSRHYVGNWRDICRGSFSWRDDHHFSWVLHTLVPQYLSNPSAYERMPRQVNYEAPDARGLWGALQPYREDAPDLVKLIHWGADVIVTQKLTHEHLKAQLAYFLYAWPWLEAWLPAQNYATVRDFAFATWAQPTCDREYPYDESPEHDLFALKTKIGTTKGAYPPGFSVQPNLMMFAVARREGRPDAGRFLEAAQRQTAWMIANLDWEDPQTTKGQRMSEFLTATGLVHFLKEFPDQAPAGLREKLDAWTRVALRRADNLWDFRRLTDDAGWVPTGPARTMWNEPGNVLGLPGPLLAVYPFIDDDIRRARLEQVAYAHFDNGFGRNPTGRHFSYDAPRELEGVEFGWYVFYHGGIGQLEKARFVIDGAPKTQHYPYHPEVGNVGWTEGWVQFNAAFNQSLAWLAHHETSVSVRRDGAELVVQLTAPLNFDYAQVETGRVRVTIPGGDAEWVTVTEDGPNARTLTGRVSLSNAAGVRADDGSLQAAAGASVHASYGYGFLAKSATLRL